MFQVSFHSVKDPETLEQ